MPERKRPKRYGRVKSPKGHHYTPRPKNERKVEMKDANGNKKSRTIYENGANGAGMVAVGRKQIDILTGKDDLSDWTDEELMKGSRGRGVAPTIIPAVVHQELARRIMTRAQHTFVAELTYAIQKHMEIIENKSGEVDPRTELRAIEMLYERVLGRPTESITIKPGGEQEDWMKLMVKAIVPSREEAEKDDIIEGEVVEDG
jgi:hypothetical protein